MSITIINRCRPAIVAFALATVGLSTGCIAEAELEDGYESLEAEVEHVQRATESRDSRQDFEQRAESEQPRPTDDVRHAEQLAVGNELVADVNEAPWAELPELVQELAADINSGDVTLREAALIAIIQQVDSGEPVHAWADPALRTIRKGHHLPGIDAEEAEFVAPGTPLQH